MFAETLESLRIALELLAYSAVAFVGLALLVKGKEAIVAGRRAIGEIRLNLTWGLADVIFVGPVLAVAVTAIRLFLKEYSLMLSEETWEAIGAPLTLFFVFFLGDFISYWRHRLEHTRWLWPSHAIHHSDTQMTWLTLARFHPVNRAVTTLVDVTLLAMLGFPAWALVGNQILRHYYGEFIHADFPWMYGPFRRVFVSPVMHQWHHARDVVGAGNNFATVFAVIDVVFGTYHVPGPCNVPLGVTDEIGPGFTRQLMYPFVCWFQSARRLLTPRTVEPKTDAV